MVSHIYCEAEILKHFKGVLSESQIISISDALMQQIENDSGTLAYMVSLLNTLNACD
jgi:hypothetical protein